MTLFAVPVLRGLVTFDSSPRSETDKICCRRSFYPGMKTRICPELNIPLMAVRPSLTEHKRCGLPQAPPRVLSRVLTGGFESAICSLFIGNRQLRFALQPLQTDPRMFSCLQL